MIRLILILLILNCGNLFGQTVRVATSTSANAPTVFTQTGTNAAIKAAVDAMASTLRAEMKAGDAANQKALTDSMASLAPVDTNTIKLVNGRFTVNYKPSFDSTGKVQTNLTATTKTVTDAILILGGRTTTLENKVSSLEAWRGTVDAQLTTINAAIATIPKKAVSVSTTTTTTTLQ